MRVPSYSKRVGERAWTVPVRRDETLSALFIADVDVCIGVNKCLHQLVESLGEQRVGRILVQEAESTHGIATQRATTARNASIMLGCRLV